MLVLCSDKLLHITNTLYISIIILSTKDYPKFHSLIRTLDITIND